MNSAIDSEFIGWHGKVQEVKRFCKPPMLFPQIYRNYILLLEVIFWLLNKCCKSYILLQNQINLHTPLFSTNQSSDFPNSNLNKPQNTAKMLSNSECYRRQSLWGREKLTLPRKSAHEKEYFYSTRNFY